jgi:hypothetical protein
MFIPEIGTEITLAEDWNFKLHIERRNDKLIELCRPEGYVRYNQRYDNEKRGWFYYWSDSEYQRLSDQYYQELCSLKNARGSNWNTTEENADYHRKLNELLACGKHTQLIENNCLDYTLPAGTVLKVDRIYIRKGKGMSDYSSVTFYATIGKKKYRFWSKLADVNNIKFT